MKKLLLEIVVFICGALVMVFEMVGARILGPWVGTSLFIWTSLIGIILGSLSVGYWLGGKLADKKPDYNVFGYIILLAGLSILFTWLIKDPFLRILSRHIADIRIIAIVSSLFLFAPGSIFLGMVSPYAVKLKLQSLQQSGRTVGNLYAVSTIGSIAGTFGAGFYLIPAIGTNMIVLVIAGILLVIAFLMFFLNKKYFNAVISAAILGYIIVIANAAGKTTPSYVDVDTLYNRVLIYNTTDDQTGKEIKILKINDERSAAIFLDSDELVFDYLKYYHLAAHFKPDMKKALMIGGSAYTYPRDFLRKYPGASIDVVEIDPELTQLAKKYFGLQDQPRLNIIHEDGRTFLNRWKDKYDVIFMDAFRSQFTVPYQLTTKECVQEQYDLLNDGGVVVANIISSLDGKSNLFLQAQSKTYRDVFPQVYYFAVKDPQDKNRFQNIMIVALKSTQQPSMTSADSLMNVFLSHRVDFTIGEDIPVLTDNFAPVEYYSVKALTAFLDSFNK